MVGWLSSQILILIRLYCVALMFLDQKIDLFTDFDDLLVELEW